VEIFQEFMVCSILHLHVHLSREHTGAFIQFQFPYNKNILFCRLSIARGEDQWAQISIEIDTHSMPRLLLLAAAAAAAPPLKCQARLAGDIKTGLFSLSQNVQRPKTTVTHDHTRER
jgi:hypothetical protein